MRSPGGNRVLDSISVIFFGGSLIWRLSSADVLISFLHLDIVVSLSDVIPAEASHA